MSPDSTRAPFTDAEQAYYNQLDEDVTAGRIPAIGRGTRRDGSRISDTDLDAILRAHRDFAEKGEEEASAAPDDAALVEAAGLPVVLVRGSERSMKITRPIDLAIAQLLADDPSLGV